MRFRSRGSPSTPPGGSRRGPVPVTVPVVVAGTALVVGLAAAACGDPVVILGDAPGLMRIVAGIPDEPGATAAPRATGSHLNTPRGVTVAAEGVAYIADQRTARILAVSSSGELDVVVDHGGCGGGECIERPDGIALAPDGSLVVADPLGNRLWRVDPEGGGASVLAGTGDGGSSPDGVPAADAPLGTPTGVAVDAQGRVFFTERTNQRVRGIASDGTLFTVAGDGVQGFAGDGGPATSARISSPAGLAEDDGLLYLADTGNHRIRRISLSTGRIETVAGNGQRAYAGDGGPATDASFKLPEAVAVSPDGGMLFVADVVDNRVRAVSFRSGRISTFAGTGADAFESDLLAAGETALNRPGGLATSDLGFLFIADSGHHIVWRTPLELR